MITPTTLLACDGGVVVLPGKLLNDRRDGGHLLVNPPRDVWERGDLTPSELTAWSFLVAATGQAMLEALPQLAGGCINYWEAGNWALHDLAEPAGPKTPQDHRRVHLHVFGRSRTAEHPDWRWGESPRFPDFIDSQAWSSQFEGLRSDETAAILTALRAGLLNKYGMVSR